MNAFMNGFNRGPALPALRFAGITHLWFVSIHPFEDGNGRIARALSEKALALRVEQPLLLALSQTIQQNKKAYYTALAENSRELYPHHPSTARHRHARPTGFGQKRSTPPHRRTQTHPLSTQPVRPTLEKEPPDKKSPSWGKVGHKGTQKESADPRRLTLLP